MAFDFSSQIDVNRLLEYSRKGESISSISAKFNTFPDRLLPYCERLAGIKEHDVDDLSIEQIEEYFNRCRPGLLKCYKESCRPVPVDFGGQPFGLSGEIPQKHPIKLSKRIPDPFLRPPLKSKQYHQKKTSKTVVPNVPKETLNTGYEEKKQIRSYRKEHPLAVFTLYKKCLSDCPVGKKLAYNQKCPHSGGVFPYNGTNYAACLYKEQQSKQ